MKKKSKYKYKSLAIILYNKYSTVYGEYSSLTNASLSLKYESKTITRALSSKRKMLKRRRLFK